VFYAAVDVGTLLGCSVLFWSRCVGICACACNSLIKHLWFLISKILVNSDNFPFIYLIF